MVVVRRATLNDLNTWLDLRKKLWPHCQEEEHIFEINGYLTSPEECALMACDDTKIIGFCECGLRKDYVEGARNSPTAYLEGIFVDEPFRRL